MTFKRPRGASAGLVAILFFLACCPLNTQTLPLPCSSQEQKSEYAGYLSGMYPQTYSAVQRIVLRIRSKHYDFLGHLAMKRNGRFRATAFGEMGGKVFDLSEEEGRVELLENPLRLPAKPLAEGVSGDIRHLFDINLSGRSYLVGHEDNSFSLVDPETPGSFSEYFFRGDGQELTSSRSLYEGRLVREVKYAGYTGYEGIIRPLPKKIYLKNHRWRYELEIELLSISPNVRKIEKP